MPDLNIGRREIRVQIVYVGPALGGKTTSVRYVAEALALPWTPVDTDGERTILFDFLHLGAGAVAGWKTAFNVHTVPGQTKFRAAREMVLKNADGVVFVADSAASRLTANRYAMEDVLGILGAGRTLPPLVVQLNKRDVHDALPIPDLVAALGVGAAPVVASVATRGNGVFRALDLAMKRSTRKAIRELELPVDAVAV